MAGVCGDNRFEIIAKVKEHLIKATNIEMHPEELAQVDNILFRLWQLGYFNQSELEKENIELQDKLKNLASVAEVRLANWQKYEKENKELKSRDCWKSCEYANPKAELIGQHIKDIQNLAKAKELLKRFMKFYERIARECYSKGFQKTLTETEQFLKEQE